MLQEDLEPMHLYQSFQASEYSVAVIRSPFEPSTPSGAQKLSGGNLPDKLKNNLLRPKEPLELYPLDSLKMVGIFNKNEQFWALLKDATGLIHRVSIGNYVGQNFGKVENITEKTIEIVEWVSEAEGKWNERTIVINLIN